MSSLAQRDKDSSESPTCPSQCRVLKIRTTVGMDENDDTELLLSLLAEVEEQLAISRGCVHDASNKFEEGKEFEVDFLQ